MQQGLTIVKRMDTMLPSKKHYLLTAVLLMVNAALIFAAFFQPPAVTVSEPTNVVYNASTQTVQLDSLTLEQKIAQMIVTYGHEHRAEQLQNLLIGGVHIGAQASPEAFREMIDSFQRNATIPFLVTADLEGCINPFSAFRTFPAFKNIDSVNAAYQTGDAQGELLRRLGFDATFAPVVDLNDTIWQCRSFEDSPRMTAKKANAYIDGLQEHGIIATAKHYPGKTLIEKDPHKELSSATVSHRDLVPFQETMRNNVSAIMPSHVIVNGTVRSYGKPADASQQLIAQLRSQFNGLIVTDEIRMDGLQQHYETQEAMYRDMFQAPNDLILYFDSDPRQLQDLITTVAAAVREGTIAEERIDASVKRIMEAKGWTVRGKREEQTHKNAQGS